MRLTSIVPSHDMRVCSKMAAHANPKLLWKLRRDCLPLDGGKETSHSYDSAEDSLRSVSFLLVRLSTLANDSFVDQNRLVRLHHLADYKLSILLLLSECKLSFSRYPRMAECPHSWTECRKEASNRGQGQNSPTSKALGIVVLQETPNCIIIRL